MKKRRRKKLRGREAEKINKGGNSKEKKNLKDPRLSSFPRQPPPPSSLICFSPEIGWPPLHLKKPELSVPYGDSPKQQNTQTSPPKPSPEKPTPSRRPPPSFSHWLSLPQPLTIREPSSHQPSSIGRPFLLKRKNIAAHCFGILAPRTNHSNTPAMVSLPATHRPADPAHRTAAAGNLFVSSN